VPTSYGPDCTADGRRAAVTISVMGAISGGDTGTGQPPATTRGAVRRWLSGLGIKQITQLLTLALLAATALFGGLDTVHKGVSTFAPGDDFTDGAFTVNIARAAFVPEVNAGPRTVAPAIPGSRYLGLVATVRNDGTVPQSVDDEFDLIDQPGKRFVGVYRNTDGSRLTRLGPGLSEQVAVLWTLPEKALTQGDSITVRVWQKQFRELMVTYGKTWVDSLTDYGQVVVPVRVPQ